MRTIAFAKRCFKELIRDPFNLIFCIGLPLFLLVIFQQFDIPDEIYNINNFGPGIIIFSFGFISLFSGQLIARDRNTSLLTRLFVSPLKPFGYLLGYTLSLIPIIIAQIALFLGVGLLLGLNLNINIVFTTILCIPISLLYISLGLIVGCIFNDKQAPAFGSIVIQLIAFTSGLWFNIDGVQNLFGKICNILPFRYSIDLARNIVTGIGFEWKTIIILVTYTIILYVSSALLFKRVMTKDNK